MIVLIISSNKKHPNELIMSRVPKSYSRMSKCGPGDRAWRIWINRHRLHQWHSAKARRTRVQCTVHSFIHKMHVLCGRVCRSFSSSTVFVRFAVFTIRDSQLISVDNNCRLLLACLQFVVWRWPWKCCWQSAWKTVCSFYRVKTKAVFNKCFYRLFKANVYAVP